MKDGDQKKDAAPEPEPPEPTPTPASPPSPSTPPVATTDSVPASKKKHESSVPWPLRDIKEPHEHDVLYGRGGGTNHHIGNKRYRQMVEDKKVDYVNSKRLDKPLVALNIIRQWREQDPSGRFLKLDERTGLWHDVGDKKAREKTSQALREKAPELRKQQEVGKVKKDCKLASDEVDDNEPKHKGKDKKVRGKKTAFNVPEGAHKQRDRKDIKHLMLARDHSLGRDYLKPNEQVDLDGFSWDEPVGDIYGKKERNYSRQRQDRASFPPTRGEGWGSGRFANLEPSSASMPPPPPGPYPSHSAGTPGEFQSMMPPPDTRVSREHSLAMNPLSDADVDGPAKNPFPREGKSVSGGGLDEAWARGATHPSHQHYGLPPPTRQTSQSRYLSNEGSSAFSRTPSTHGGDKSRRSAESAEEPHYRSRSSSGRSMGHEYSQGSFDGGSGPSRRDWSSQDDDYRKVAGDDHYEIRRSWSGQSDEYTRATHYPPPDRGAPYPPSDGHSYSSRDSWPRPYSAALREGGPPQYAPPPQHHGAPHHAPPPRNSPPQSTPSHGSYHHLAKRDSGSGMSVDEGRGVEMERAGKDLAKPNLRRKISGGGVTPKGPPQPPPEAKRGLLARPQPVKRDTSHQCENDETKSRVKRSFLSPREHGGPTGGAFEEEERINDLETSFQKSHLNSSVGSSVSSTVKPSAVSAKSRLSTVDAIGMAFGANTSSGSHEPERAKTDRPIAVSAKNRLTTTDAISMAFADSLRGEDTGKAKAKENAEGSSPPADAKPKAITEKNRLSTEEAIGLALAKPQNLSEDQRLTSLGDLLDGDDLLIDPVSADEVLGVGELSESKTASKPDHLSAKQRVTTVDALLMEIEDEVDAFSRPDHSTSGQRAGITNGSNDDAIAQAWLDS
uniref:DUF6824 domain-containing protein n=1 Tax=Odontella aurita TaxID=265563 RepID=A0A7S4N5D4_9STRA|mmetsp:Transcript_47438/g.143613  ORF Transcript_47438/g.143613 Transcript_47438/m.143613 type:complete len:895 (+) Transcript_47438:210-2894(+)|eukprot:CAMPEP_0113554666 /NCGR_PEP_ID=MMETSP0015_2-20120614/16279_1 /TAXON_ID=2838 /ORGANISM="Odontella" /LENGTH=894 /DNA_ID=CAMNT_0000455839 /DNA_START=177 /DNA_END=2861 /DNA_ORIENTATION=+ /assembly_acc=CAM_ASM_000160